jgi:hypothetical protein
MDWRGEPDDQQKQRGGLSKAGKKHCGLQCVKWRPHIGEWASPAQSRPAACISFIPRCAAANIP